MLLRNIIFRGFNSFEKRLKQRKKAELKQFSKSDATDIELVKSTDSEVDVHAKMKK